MCLEIPWTVLVLILDFLLLCDFKDVIIYCINYIYIIIYSTNQGFKTDLLPFAGSLKTLYTLHTSKQIQIDRPQISPVTALSGVKMWV